MRAETQNTVAAIEKSLALLRQRMDWDTAQHRLEEFNALIEDPDLWNDPERAQKLMRDRQTLVDAMDRYRAMSQDLADNVELIELGEAEDDEEVVRDAEEALKRLAERAARPRSRRCWTARPTATTPSSRSTPAPAAPKAATGRRCWRGCTSAGPRSTATRSS